MGADLGRVAVERRDGAENAWRGIPQAQRTCQQRPVFTIGVVPGEHEMVAPGSGPRATSHAPKGGVPPADREPSTRRPIPSGSWEGSTLRQPAMRPVMRCHWSDQYPAVLGSVDVPWWPAHDDCRDGRHRCPPWKVASAERLPWPRTHYHRAPHRLLRYQPAAVGKPPHCRSLAYVSSRAATTRRLL